MLFDTGLTALACFVTLALCYINPDSSKPTDGNQVLLSTDTDQLSETTLRACIAAPNCETYQSDHGTRIRFRAGHEPGSIAYKQRFGTNNVTMSVPVPGENAPKAGRARNFDSVNTNIDMGDSKILYGSTKPYDAIHNIWDHCGSSSCDTHSFTVDTSSVANVGQGNTLEEGSTLTITADGQYNGYGERAAYITAILTASSQGQTSRPENWHFRAKGDGVESGTITVYTQTDYIGVNKFSGGSLQGFMTVKVDQAAEKSGGWCGTAAGAFAAVVGALEPENGAFFGLIGVFCAAGGL
jgi:hypothetical protein